MKQVIRLTESDLHRIIKESVRQVLREGREAPIYNDNSELIDTGGEYNPDEYDTYDEYDELKTMQNYNSRLSRDIERGKYDDNLDDFLSPESEYGRQAAFDRKCLIDKKFALKNGIDPDTPSPVDYRHPHHSNYLASYNGNTNRFDNKYDRSTSAAKWLQLLINMYKENPSSIDNLRWKEFFSTNDF